MTYSHVRFKGTGSSPSSSGRAHRLPVQPGNISNITFDHCVFATLPEGVFGNAVHMWNTSTTGKTIRNITFKDCWFEPQPRMVIEMNGRGGWWHDVTIDHCTFEAGGGQMLSFDMSPVSGDPVAPWGVKVGGVVRGVEGLHITNNDFRGTGVTVNGFAPRYTMGFEFGCVYPYAKDPSIGRSEFTGNRVARCASAWFQCNRNGARGMTFADNLFDFGYNPGGIARKQLRRLGGTSINDCTFINNTYVLAAPVEDRPWDLLPYGLAGRGNTFSGEDWTKPAGRMASRIALHQLDLHGLPLPPAGLGHLPGERLGHGLRLRQRPQRRDVRLTCRLSALRRSASRSVPTRPTASTTTSCVRLATTCRWRSGRRPPRASGRWTLHASTPTCVPIRSAVVSRPTRSGAGTSALDRRPVVDLGQK